MRRKCSWVVLALVLAGLANSSGAAEGGNKPSKPVLLVIDVQNKYLGYFLESEKKIAFEMINYAIWLFRQTDLPVVRVYNTDPTWGPEPGTEEFEFTPVVKVKPDDPRIIKNYGNAFKKTGLEKFLRENGTNTVFLCGLSAVGCVLATYFGAMDLDFNVFLVKDALISQSPEYTNFVEEIFDTVSLNAIEVMLGCAQD